MAPKLQIYEKCKVCGVTVARLDGEYIKWDPGACKCPKRPGPPAPPRSISLRSAIFIPAEKVAETETELREAAEEFLEVLRGLPTPTGDSASAETLIEQFRPLLEKCKRESFESAIYDNTQLHIDQSQGSLAALHPSALRR